MVSTQEVEWLERARTGDDDAFAQMVETYQKPVFNLCFRMLGDGQDAEDAAQESFWRAYQALNRYDSSRSFITWLLSIAAHYCIDQQRRRKLPSFSIDDTNEEILPDNTPHPEKIVSQNQRDQMLHRMLNDLKPEDRAAIIMRYWYGFSDQEISEALTLTVSAVKSRLHRARLLLAERLQDTQSEYAF